MYNYTHTHRIFCTYKLNMNIIYNVYIYKYVHLTVGILYMS